MKNQVRAIIRSLIGLGEINKRFDEVETVLRRIEHDLSEVSKNQKALLEVVEKYHEAELNALNRAYIEIGRSVSIGSGVNSGLRELIHKIELTDRSSALSTLESNQDRLLEISESIFEKIPSKNEQEVNRDKIIHQVNYTNHNLYAHLKEASVTRECNYNSLLDAIKNNSKINKNLGALPVAYTSALSHAEVDESSEIPRYMQPIDAKEMLIWIAIPKTATTSLAEILIPKLVERGLGFNSMAKDKTSALGVQTHAVIEEIWSELSEQERRKMTYTGGHIPFGIHENFKKKASYITFLRHPLELVQSYYSFFCSVLPVYRAAKDSGMTLERALKERIMPGLFNLQTRMLSGIPELFPTWISDCHSESQPLNWYTPEVCEVPEYALEMAKDNLTKLFSVVGISEQYNKSLIVLKARLGFSMSELIGRRKKVGSYEKLLKEGASENGVVDMVMKANELDIQLYDFAHSILDKEWENLSEVVKKEKEELDQYDSYIASKFDEDAKLNAIQEIKKKINDGST
jgi:Sulfotransferase family